MSTKLKRLIVVVLIVGLFGIFGIRIGHPQSGLSTALGSASSSLVVYKSTQDLNVGAKYFGEILVKDQSPALGEVTEVGKDFYTIRNGNFLERVTKEDTRGRMIVVIPFFGYLFNIVGL